MSYPYNHTFGGINSDIDREDLLNFPGERLFSACRASKYINSLCDSSFWKRKFIMEYGPPFNISSVRSTKDIDYRKLYNKIYTRSLEEQLALAAKRGYTNLVVVLLNQGANIHYYDSYALKLAAGQGYTETVQLLLDCGPIFMRVGIPR